MTTQVCVRCSLFGSLCTITPVVHWWKDNSKTILGLNFAPARRGMLLSSMVALRSLSGDRLPAVATEDFKVTGVGGPHFAAVVQFCHAHDAGIGKINGPVSILLRKFEHFGNVIGQLKIENEISSRNQLHAQARIAHQKSQFIQNRFAGVKRERAPETLRLSNGDVRRPCRAAP